MNFIKEYKSGLTIRQIAIKHNLSYETVRKSLKGKVTWHRKYISDFSKKEQDKAVKMFDDGKSVKEIANWFEISYPAISRLLRANNRFPVCSCRKYDVLRETPITSIQKQFLVGHILGDGCVYRDGPKSMYKIEVSHKKEHAQYFHWKVSMLDPFINTWRESFDKRGNSIMLNSTTICHHGFKIFADMFYDNQRIKHVPDGLEMYLTPLALAVWIMDDGNLNNGVNLRMATHSFTESENYKLRDYLRSLYSVRSKVFKVNYKNKIYYRLSINKENTIKISNIVRPYIIDCMKYKIMSESSTTTCQTPNMDDDIV